MAERERPSSNNVGGGSVGGGVVGRGGGVGDAGRDGWAEEDSSCTALREVGVPGRALSRRCMRLEKKPDRRLLRGSVTDLRRTWAVESDGLNGEGGGVRSWASTDGEGANDDDVDGGGCCEGLGLVGG